MNKLFGENKDVWIKLERNNPGGSIKDRIALAMIEDAESTGALKKGGIIIEPTSGNTGVGLALVAAVKGYKAILVMPESMSIERRRLMAIFGAELKLTPREKGMPGAIEAAKQLVEQTPGAWMPSQFDNPANPRVHAERTANEILEDFPQGIDYLITGVGTGGHIAGIATTLKKKFPNTKIIAVEPEASPVLSGGGPSPHKIQGIGAGFVPSVYIPELVDEVITVKDEEAFDFARRSAKSEGILVGVSTGATLAAVAKKINKIPEGSTILAVNYDTGERYLSVDGLFT